MSLSGRQELPMEIIESLDGNHPVQVVQGQAPGAVPECLDGTFPYCAADGTYWHCVRGVPEYISPPNSYCQQSVSVTPVITIALSATSVTQGQGLTVTGTVKKPDGTPIAGLRVRLAGSKPSYDNYFTIVELTSDSNGNLRYDLPGTFNDELTGSYARYGCYFIEFGQTIGSLQVLEAQSAQVFWDVTAASTCEDGIYRSQCSPYFTSDCQLIDPNTGEPSRFTQDGHAYECKKTKDCKGCYVDQGLACQQGEKYNISMCADGVTPKSYRECDGSGNWIEKTNTCPEEICTDGVVRPISFCSDGVTIKEYEECVDGSYVRKSYDCPTEGPCTNGQRQVLTYCADGKTVKTYNECVNGELVEKAGKCSSYNTGNEEDGSNTTTVVIVAGAVAVGLLTLLAATKKKGA